MYKRALIGAMALALTACSGANSADTAAKSKDLAGLSGQIGSKDFAEQYILAHLTTKLLNAHGASLEANTKLVGSANVRQALENKQFVGYWEYTGTSWITYNKQTTPLKTEKSSSTRSRRPTPRTTSSGSRRRRSTTPTPSRSATRRRSSSTSRR